jgi:hypothetical protein
MSLAKAQRRKGMKKPDSELGVFAPLREKYPNPRVFDFLKNCAGRENVQHK